MATKAEKILESTTISATTNTEVSDLRYVESVSAQIVVSNASSPTGASAQLQGSNDGTNWVNIGSAQNITANGTLLLEDADVSYRYCRVGFAISSGSFDGEVIVAGKEC